MIEFYLVGTLFSYIQFNRYIDYAYEYDKKNETASKCTALSDKDISKYEFDRYEFLLLFVYNLLNTLFFILIFVYCVYFIDIVLSKKRESSDTPHQSLFVSLATKHPKFSQFIVNPNSFMKYIVKFLLISFISNLAFVNLLIVFRDKKTDNDKKIIKADMHIMFVFLIVSSIFTFLYI